MTQAGMILGTAAYMSPEQARGMPVDNRTDLWAFGCVLYEMLTGRRAFEGEDVTITLANIVRGEPAWTSLPPETPASLRRLLRRCLTKDPKRRLREAASAMLDIDDAKSGEMETAASGAPPQARPWRRLGATAALLTLGMVAAGAAAWNVARKPEAPPQVVRFSIPLENGITYSSTGRRIVAISPDGSRLAYVANARIYLRALHDASATPVRGTEVGSGRGPFFSPDGQWLGFWAGRALEKVAVSGGAPVTLATMDSPLGASWGADDKILVGQGTAGILQISGSGARGRCSEGRSQVSCYRRLSARVSCDPARAVLVERWADIAVSLSPGGFGWGSPGGNTEQQSDGYGEEMLDVEQAMICQPEGDHCLD